MNSYFPKVHLELELTRQSNSHYFFNYLNETRSAPHLRPPISLESLSIHMHNAYHAKEVLDLSEIAPLLTLPKLNTLILGDVKGPFHSSRISPINRNTEARRTSPLKVLEIKHSCLSVEGLNTILSRKLFNEGKRKLMLISRSEIVALEIFECRISDNDGGYSSGHTDSLSQILTAVSCSFQSSRIIFSYSFHLIGDLPW